MQRVKIVTGTAIMHDVRAVHETLAVRGDEVRLSVSQTAELVSRVVDARAQWEQVLFTRSDAE